MSHPFALVKDLWAIGFEKRTMEAADCLYGVTMQPAGSSKVVSEKVTAGA